MTACGFHYCYGAKVETGLGFLYNEARLCRSDLAMIDHSPEVGSKNMLGGDHQDQSGD
jgi:hypothetical protein